MKTYWRVDAHLHTLPTAAPEGVRIVLKWILGKIGYEGVECFHLAQDGDQW